MVARRWLWAAALVGLGGGAGTALTWSGRPTLVEVRPRPTGGLMVRDVRVVDVEAGVAVEHRDVLVQGEHITAVLPHDPTRTAEEVVDGAGATLVPGLVDSHVHVLSSSGPPGALALPDPELTLERLLFSGVTTVFDPGSDPEEIFALRAELAAEAVPGPTLWAAGPVFTAPGGHPVPMVREMAPPVLREVLVERLARQVGTPEAAVAAVDALAPAGPDLLKFAIDEIPFGVPRLDPDVAAAVVTAGAAHGLRTVAHIGTVSDAHAAAAAGASAWIHGVYKERIPDAEIDALAELGLPMVPTMVVFSSFGGLGQGTYTPTALEAAMAPADLFEAWADPQLETDAPPEIRTFIEALRALDAAALDNVGRLHAAGTTILAGSDSQSGMLPGASLHKELQLLAEAGLDASEVLRAATVAPARFLSGEHDPPFGVVAEGRRADLLLVEGDPLTDVAALSRIRAVVVRGRLVVRTPWPPSG